MRALIVAVTLAIAFTMPCGCTTSRPAPPAQTPNDVAATVLSLLNHWDAERFRSLDWQPNNVKRLKYYETHCFRPGNAMASGGLRFRITKTEVSGEEARVYFDILFSGKLKVPRQESDPSQPDLVDRGHLFLVRVGNAWKLREISF